MRSIGKRIAIWYAFAATLTLFGLFCAGYVLLERHLFNGLDLLNDAEFQQIAARLGPEYQSISEPFIEMRIRETTELASTLFYIEIKRPESGVVFRSTNLKGFSIPVADGPKNFNVNVDGVGEIRAAEFQMLPLSAVIATPLQPVRDVMKNYVRVCVALLVGMLFASLLIGASISRLLLLPIRRIRDTANRIRFDNLSERIAVSGDRDEVTDLVRLLNQMFDRIEVSFNQVNRFTAEASHELKTPLTLVRLHAEKMLRDERLITEHRDAAQMLIEEVDRLTQIIENLLFLSRADAHAVSLDLQPHSVSKFLENFRQDAVVLAEYYEKHFAMHIEQDKLVSFDPKTMRQVLFNLLSNAIHASPVEGLITLHSNYEQNNWVLAIEDEGSGLDSSQREQVFGRFVRFASSQSNSQGSGLGLAICHSIVQLHRGEIKAVEASKSQGLRIEIRIPVQGTSPRA